LEKLEESMETTQSQSVKTTQLAPSLAVLTLILGLLTAFGPLTIDMYLPALPTIAQDFGTDTAAVQMTLAIYFAGMAIGQAFYGPLADRLGRRRPLLFGLVLYILASVICAFATSLNGLIIGRFIQALGGCAGMVISRSAVRDLFDAKESAKIYSLLMLIMGLAPITAPFIGGQMLLYASWRWIFGILAVFGLLCLLLVLFRLPETLPAERRIKAGLGQALSVYWQLLRDRSFVGYALTGGFVSSAMFIYISASPFVFIELHGVPSEQYGWLFGINALGLIAASQLNRFMLGRFSSHQIVVTTLSLALIAAAFLAFFGTTGIGGLVALLIPLFFCIMPNGVVGPNTTALAMQPHQTVAGSASALLGTLQFILGALGGAIVGIMANGTAMPMTVSIAACFVLALLSYFTLTRGESI
jgi:DHA1 family bicyclomycin/chloramphenicol resistance-like MFS transporter